MEFKHEPVMLKECIEALNIKSDGIYVDGTLGGAGHSLEIVKMLSSKGELIGIDRDKEALKAVGEQASKDLIEKYGALTTAGLTASAFGYYNADPTKQYKKVRQFKGGVTMACKKKGKKGK